MKKNLGILVACTMVTLPSFAYNDILDLVQENDHYCSVTLDGMNGRDFGCEPGVYGRLGRGQWAATFYDNKTPISVIGDSWCSGIQGKDAWTVPAGDIQYAVDDEYAKFYSVGSPADGDYCYCKMNIPGFSQWVFDSYRVGSCVEECSGVCANNMANAYPNIMFNRVAGVDRSFTYLYNAKGNNDRTCFVDNYGDVNGNPDTCAELGVSGAWQWAAVLNDMYDKQDTERPVVGEAWVSDIADKGENWLPASAAIQDLITADFTEQRSNATVGYVGGNCYCRLNTPAESLWVLLSGEQKTLGECEDICLSYVSGLPDASGNDAVKAMFRTLKSVNSGGNGGDNPGGGGSSGGQYEYLYNSRPIGALCGLTPRGGLTGRPKDEDDAMYCKYLNDHKIIKELGQWATNYGYSTKSGGDVFDIVGAAWVSSLSPNDPRAQGGITYEYELYLTTGNGADFDGENCYCRIDTPASSEWVLAAQGGIDFTTCTMECAGNMVEYDGGSGLTRSLFDSIVAGASSSAGIKIPTSKYYVDTNLATRQDAFVGTNKPILVTYTTTDGQVDGRSIVDNVSSDVPNPDVPERGGVRYALNEKQDVVNGTANWAVTYGDAGGTFNSKPIYNTVNTNYTTALVGAETLNTAVINAVNSEFTPVANVGFLINSVNDIAQLSTQTQPQN